MKKNPTSSPVVTLYKTLNGIAYFHLCVTRWYIIQVVCPPWSSNLTKNLQTEHELIPTNELNSTRSISSCNINVMQYCYLLRITIVTEQGQSCAFVERLVAFAYTIDRIQTFESII